MFANACHFKKKNTLEISQNSEYSPNGVIIIMNLPTE